MAELVLPPIQLSEFAWGNIAMVLRDSRDPHLTACAAEIERQLQGLRDCSASQVGRVEFAVSVKGVP